jgi:hypothetical protein
MPSHGFKVQDHQQRTELKVCASRSTTRDHQSGTRRRAARSASRVPRGFPGLSGQIFVLRPLEQLDAIHGAIRGPALALRGYFGARRSPDWSGSARGWRPRVSPGISGQVRGTRSEAPGSEEPGPRHLRTQQSRGEYLGAGSLAGTEGTWAAQQSRREYLAGSAASQDQLASGRLVSSIAARTAATRSPGLNGLSMKWASEGIEAVRPAPPAV